MNVLQASVEAIKNRRGIYNVARNGKPTEDPFIVSSCEAAAVKRRSKVKSFQSEHSGDSHAQRVSGK